MTKATLGTLKVKRPWRILVVLMVVVGVGYFSWDEYHEMRGYCVAQSKYLTDDEFVLAALSHVKGEILMRDDETLQSFLNRHPDCCAIQRPSVATTLRTNWGQYLVEAELNYELTTSQVVGSDRYMTRFVEITACGSRGNMYGDRSSQLHSATERTTKAR